MSEKSKTKGKQATKEKIDKPIKESKADLFIRLGKPRIERVLKALRILGNCSKTSRYEYTPEQIDKMSIRLSEAVEKTILKFHDTKKELETFEF